MQKYSDLEYLRLSKGKKILYKIASFFAAIPRGIANFFKKIGMFFVKAAKAVGNEVAGIVRTFVKGDWKTKISFFIMGFGNIARGQVLRGVLLLLFEAVFIFYMIFSGGYWLSMMPTLGTVEPGLTTDAYGYQVLKQPWEHDHSFQILLYGVLTIFFVIAFIYTWRVNVKQNQIAEEILASGKKLKSGKQDLRSLVDDQFHKTLLALPMTGILVFTVMPMVFMILVAFTNYDSLHNGETNALFHWQGFDNFKTLLGFGGQSYGYTFLEILTWTLIWAFLATFTNYFLGMFVAMMINKKGIRFKKGWRTILVLTIAIPQFISLLYVSKMFAKDGFVNNFLIQLGWIDKALPFWEDPMWARVTLILVNIWIGIPYLMLIATGILMNIPADLYESAKIDGASGWKQYSKITLPYMLFVTGPYLLTSFINNMNNFNVIFLLSGGAPTNTAASGAGSIAGHTDLLITWLFKLTTTSPNRYYLASVIGIVVFIVVALISLIVYGFMPSVKNEEDFQ